MSKVCYLNLATYSTVGGIENYNKSFLEALDSLQEDVLSISVYDKASKDEFNNIEFKNFEGKKIRASICVFRNIYKTKKLIIAHANLLSLGILAKIFNPKIKIYLCIYGVEVWKKLPFIYRIFVRHICVLSISSHTTDLFQKYNKLSNDNIYYLPPFIKIEAENNFRNIYDEKRFNILSVSRLDSVDNYKGIDSMINTIPFLIKKIPNLKYTIVGQGDDKDRLEDIVRVLGLENYVEFKGFVEPIEPYYKYCDVFALPSKGEGFGIVFIEAMKYHKPCIACDEGGQIDIVINNRTGLLCKYDDLFCLSEKISQLYLDKSLRMTLGLNGYNHVTKNYTLETYKEKLKFLLDET